MIMQAAFFKLAEVIPEKDAVIYLKEGIDEAYGRKGNKIVEMNYKAVDVGIDGVEMVKVPAAWADVEDEPEEPTNYPDFIENVLKVMEIREGDSLPVSAFEGREDGTFPLGTSAYEKRGVAVNVPNWLPENCIQCNQCSFVCPHAAIRPIVLSEEEAKTAPLGFITIPSNDKAFKGSPYRIQVSTYDCMGCGNCADICPAKEKALVMEPYALLEKEVPNWDFGQTVSYKTHLVDKNNVKGSQYAHPYLEFSGACAGCGETPYIKLVTQLFGDRMIIANATGCSSIWGASAPSMPYCTDREGRGPAWANSLFEDNAEYGYGMLLATKQIRAGICDAMEELLELDVPDSTKTAMKEWIEGKDQGEATREREAKVLKEIKSVDTKDPLIQKKLNKIIDQKDYLAKPSIWSIGGDGWAYDIGYGGLDHVLASGENINVLVFDTEVYSNTGGQASKATPKGAVAKFAASGKKVKKKDLGMLAVTYGYIYVAQVGMGSDKNQLMKAIIEAEKYDGPSLIIAYCPCINHGIKAGMGKAQEDTKDAVDSGYWHLYRYNPDLKKEGKNPFILDSKEPTKSFREHILSHTRYSVLEKEFPELAEELYSQSENTAKETYETYRRLAADDRYVKK